MTTALALLGIVAALLAPTVINRLMGWHLPTLGDLELAPGLAPELDVMSLSEAITEALANPPAALEATDPESFGDILQANLTSLRELHRRFSRSPRTGLLIDMVEADLSYGVAGGQQLVAWTPPKR